MAFNYDNLSSIISNHDSIHTRINSSITIINGFTTSNDINAVATNDLTSLPNINEFHVIAPTDPRYKLIDFGCNCLTDEKHIKNYRKSNTFVKGVLNSLIGKVDDRLSRRTRDLTEIETIEDSLLNQDYMRNFDSYEKSNLYDTNPYSTMDDLKNYYNNKTASDIEYLKNIDKFDGHLTSKEKFENNPIIRSPLNASEIKSFNGVYELYENQFLLLNDCKMQIDDNHIGIIKHNIPVISYKIKESKFVMSPFQSFECVRYSIIATNLLVNSLEINNLNQLLETIGLKSPNLIFVSKHLRVTNDKEVKEYYRVSNRSYTTLFQCYKI